MWFELLGEIIDMETIASGRSVRDSKRLRRKYGSGRWRKRKVLRGFMNKCRHVAMTLDWVENRFFTPEGDFVLFPTHGALYEPGTGFCVFGPPADKSLIRVPLEFRGEEVWAAVPADFEDVL